MNYCFSYSITTFHWYGFSMLFIWYHNISLIRISILWTFIWKPLCGFTLWNVFNLWVYVSSVFIHALPCCFKKCTSIKKLWTHVYNVLHTSSTLTLTFWYTTIINNLNIYSIHNIIWHFLRHLLHTRVNCIQLSCGILYISIQFFRLGYNALAEFGQISDDFFQ